jgi:hypothetical protein
LEENFISKLRQTHRAAVLSGVLVLALPSITSAAPKESVVGHGRGHAHSFISTCTPKEFPPGGVCLDPHTDEPVTVPQARLAPHTTKGGQGMITRFGPLPTKGGLVPHGKAAQILSRLVPRGDLGLSASLGLAALIGVAGVTVLFRRRRAVAPLVVVRHAKENDGAVG